MIILDKYEDYAFVVASSKELTPAIMLNIEYLSKYHADEIDGEELGKINIDWLGYQNHPASYWFLVALPSGQIVGYGNYLIGTDLLRKGQKIAFMSGIFIHKDHRKGLLGYKLIKVIRDYTFKNNMADYIVFDIRPKRDFSALLKRLGAKQRSVDYVFTK